MPWFPSVAYKGSEDKTVIARIQTEASPRNPTGIPEPGKPPPQKKAEGQFRGSGPSRQGSLDLAFGKSLCLLPEGSPVLHCPPTFLFPASGFGGCLED